ncbi:hypothetical protein CEXT_660771, partial [Caerostris extrusa]
TESIHAVFVCTAFDSLRWLDTTANIKAILLSELVLTRIKTLFRDIQSTLMSSVACNQQSIRKNIGQRHKKVVVIKDLPPLIRLKQKEDSSLLDIEPNDNIGLCNLFSDNQNSC